MTNYRWGYRQVQAAQPEPIHAPAPTEQMSIANKIVLIGLFVLALGTIVVGCMSGLQ